MNWPLVPRSVHREFLASAEARAKAEHDNAQSLRNALANAESRFDLERAARIADREQFERDLAVISGAHERDMVRSETRYADLLQRFTQLRVAGAQDPTPVLPSAEREPVSEEDAAVSKVIREQADGNPALGKQLRRYARELKAEGKSSDEIIGALVEVWTSEGVAPIA